MYHEPPRASSAQVDDEVRTIVCSTNIVFFGNRDLGFRILQHLISIHDVPSVIFLHPKGSSRWTNELWDLAATTNARVLLADDLEGAGLEAVATSRPSIGVSAFFGHILRRPMLQLFPLGIINFHGSFLPWNRGRDPNVWAIQERTPAGGTIHLMDDGVDTGPILLQREILQTPDMDAGELYGRTVDTLVALFREHWSSLKIGSVGAIRQGPTASSHRRRDYERLRQLDLDKSTTVDAVLRLLRACAVDEDTAAEFVQDGTRYSVRVKITAVSAGGEK